jgi:uncharacterized membrane protein
MNKISSFLSTCFAGGLLVVLPVWLTLVLIGTVISALRGALHPFGGVPTEGSGYPDVMAVLILVLLCFLAGAFLQTSLARSIGSAMDNRFLAVIPGYRLVRSQLQRMTGEDHDHTWAVALVEIEEALVPGFVVEELPDGQYTVFVPSVPTPAAGTVYIIEPRRVHIIDVPFAKAVTCIAQWGVGSSALLAAFNAQKARSQCS